ncbi:hypothetical protein [Methylobacterium sp. J-070]|uniref:hypothetical protein n=1 Tax=Methylobacterium sp. J-070 TaxID=2836650 RepID=UPI001FBA5083|nr:hypothetical protein [Methylobacterium sp. J-070]MCJ2050151.1 hypothetical protein [Methylobacterium sp. J-070]
MHSLYAEFTPERRLDAVEPASAGAVSTVRTEPARVIEIGEITAGITVPEGRGVRFFSSARDFDDLDGVVFRTAEEAARAARQRVNARARARA